LRLLSVGPLPPTPSGVADYTADLLPHLAGHAEVAVAVPDDAPTPDVPYPVYRHSELTAGIRASFDLPIYHVGNHRFHADAVRLLGEWPGLVVLHDAVLHHLYADVMLSRGRAAAYLREVALDGGAAALRRAIPTAGGEAPPAWYEQPLLTRVLLYARGVIVHSRHAFAEVRRAHPRAVVRLVHHGVAPPPDEHPRPPDRPFTVGTFGGLTEEKRVGAVVRGFALFRRTHHDARLVLAGDAAPNVPVGELLAEHGVADAAAATGRLPLDAMERLIQECGAVVQLRWPTAGEASGATLRALRLGRPTVVAGCGWFADLPDDAGLKIPPAQPAAAEAASLADALGRLAADPDLRARLAAGARAYAARRGWPAAARAYADFARDLIAAGDPMPLGQVLAS
jgi:glycosyltransferase involved in cell wall biosynthesis